MGVLFVFLINPLLYRFGPNLVQGLNLGANSKSEAILWIRG